MPVKPKNVIFFAFARPSLALASYLCYLPPPLLPGSVFCSRCQTELEPVSSDPPPPPAASLECSRCQTEFESAAQLHRHLRRSLCSRSPQLICHHCGAQFCAQFALRKHLARAHGEGAGAPGPLSTLRLHQQQPGQPAPTHRRPPAAGAALRLRPVCGGLPHPEHPQGPPAVRPHHGETLHMRSVPEGVQNQQLAQPTPAGALRDEALSVLLRQLLQANVTPTQTYDCGA